MSITIHHDTKAKDTRPTIESVPIGSAFIGVNGGHGETDVWVKADYSQQRSYDARIIRLRDGSVQYADSKQERCTPVDLHVYVGDPPAPYVESGPAVTHDERLGASNKLRSMKRERDNAVAHQERAQHARDEAVAYTDIIEGKLKAERSKSRDLRKLLKDALKGGK